MENYERDLTNCSLSLILHPSSVSPKEAPVLALKMFIIKKKKKNFDSTKAPNAETK